MMRILEAAGLVKGKNRRRRRGFTLIELLVVVVIIGILASVALPSFVGAQDKARNASVVANVNSIRMALEQYATDFNGSYPSQAQFITGLSAGGYLPGNRLPKSPWGNSAQAAVIPPANPLTLASALVTAALPSLGTVVGATGNVRNPPAAMNHFGAVMYDYDVDSQIYVVYGTGKKARSAILAGATSNGSN
ncbi:MAG: prepilin-type N-terminal cleavage/methylation domain-containing protein [Candidatus Sericytochromatia bacterium]|nr:prepilin-type N-terminal cleavage/methylation domain-containing protein [Candidatus Sericytochromatia bacterium]